MDFDVCHALSVQKVWALVEGERCMEADKCRVELQGYRSGLWQHVFLSVHVEYVNRQFLDP